MSLNELTATKLFIDGGDPEETFKATKLLADAGYKGLDGQTTNPSLVAKNPDLAKRIAVGDLMSKEELLEKYKEIVTSIEGSAQGDISIEVYADSSTEAETMIEQAREFNSWIDSAVIKLPVTEHGLIAASELSSDMKLNMTLCFSQQQAAAVYAATRGSKYPVFISPFLGRLDDQNQDGMSLVVNLMKMFKGGDGHAHVLAASLRNLEHVLGVLSLGVHAMTLPFDKVFIPWAEGGFSMPSDDYVYATNDSEIEYESLNLDEEWESFDIKHELTDVGLQKFADDWNSLLKT